MKSQQCKSTHELDQEKKIMQQIHDINKKLSANSFSMKNPPSKIYSLKQSHDPEQNYFSQQCEDLFADHNYPLKVQSADPLDSSLFNSNNSLLLGNQFEKEKKNFPEFSTNKSPSQIPVHLLNFNNQIPSNEPIKVTFYNSKSNESKNSSTVTEKRSRVQTSMNSICKIPSQKTLNSAASTQKNTKEKKFGTKNLERFIENKENIQPASNLSKKQCFIKEIKNKIRFPTEPSECNPIKNDDSSSFQNSKELRIDRTFEYLMHQTSKSKNKLNHQPNALECTFKPSILKRSNDIAQYLQPSFQRLTQEITISKSQSKLPYKAKQELTQKKYSVKRLEQLSQPRKLKQQTEKQEPTFDFRPTLSKKSLQQMANCTMDVASRNKLWLEQKEAKLSKLKSEEEEKKLKKDLGPFAPKIIPYKGENQVHLSRFTKQGISSYFERVSMAKQKIQTVEKKKPPAKEQIRQINPSMKKKTYDEAVKELHKRILTMNI